MLDSRCGFMANGEFLFAAASSALRWERCYLSVYVWCRGLYVCLRTLITMGQGLLHQRYNNSEVLCGTTELRPSQKKLRVKNTVHVVHGGRNPPQKETCAFCPKNLLRRNIIYVKLNTLWRLFCFNYRLLRFEAKQLFLFQITNLFHVHRDIWKGNVCNSFSKLAIP